VPVIGYFDPFSTAASAKFLSDAVKWSGAGDHLRMNIAGASNVAKIDNSSTPVSGASEFEKFIDGIDILILPYAEDRMIGTMLSALRQQKMVIAPDSGCPAELLEFGLFGMLFKSGSRYHLAEAISTAAHSWGTRPIEFDGYGPASSKTNARAVAAQFKAAYTKLVSLCHAA